MKLLVRKFFGAALLLGISWMMNLLSGTTVFAGTIKVNTVAALQASINSAQAGDSIVLANGTYLNNVLNISKNNISVLAETPGGVYLNGTNDINISGSYILFRGFQFTQGDIGAAYLIEVYGSNNVLTQLNFSGYSAKKYIEIKAGTQYNEISYCNIEKKPAAAEIGCTIQISTSATVPGYHIIRYCSFQNYYGLGSDYGNEPIRIGLGAEALNASRTIVEHCYFNNTGLGDSETVSVKSKENVIRFCTFTNQQNAMLCFRNGDDNAAYSNFFINAGGIRVKEANNIYCYNNYFENSGVGSSADAVTYIYVAPLVPPTVDAPRTSNLVNINFIHNTFYNCGSIDLGGAGATNNTWANNIFKKTSGSIFKNANSGTTWLGNIGSGTFGITIPSGITNVDPLLTVNANGYRGITALSPAINAASTAYPAIVDIANIDDDPTLLYDISGQPRAVSKSLKDVGCDEDTTGTITNHPLLVTQVGPAYLNGPKLQTISFAAIPAKSITDAAFSPNASATSGLAITYQSSNSSVATIVNNMVTIVGAGSTVITASQPGSDEYVAAPSVTQTLTVGKVNQTITFGAIAAKTIIDPAFTLSATSSAGLTVTYQSSNTAVATIVNNTVTIVGIGSAIITASQPGNSSYNAAADVSQTLTVGKVNQTITFGAIAAKTIIDPAFTLNATSTSGLAVTYQSSNTAVATIVNNTVTIVGIGSAIITASQSGNASYNAAADVSQTLTVSKVNQTITFAAIAAKTIIDPAFTLNATSTSGLTVTYQSSNTAVATIVNNTVTIVGIGSAIITASQPGNSSYNVAADVSQTLTVSKVNQTITFAALAAKLITDPAFTLSATSSAGLTVTYQSSNTAVATIVNNTVTIVGIGSAIITASQPGNASYNAAADVSQTLTVGKLNQTIAFAALAAKLITDPAFSLSATSSAGLPVTFQSSNTAVATIVNNTLTIVGVGSAIITASQSGNANYNAATDVAQTLVVGKANQTITFGPLPSKIISDAPFSLSATSSAGLAVVYKSSNTSVAKITNNILTILGIGSSIITATQPGNASYNAATDVPQSLTVKLPVRLQNNTSFYVYPNPISNIANIYYRLLKSSVVRIELLDLNGRIIKNILANEQQGAGDYNRRIILSNLTGGNYFICLKTDDLSQTFPIVVLK